MMKNKMPTGAATPMGEVGRQKKRRKLSVHKIITLLLGIVTIAIFAAYAWPQDTIWVKQSHIVVSGETIWSIAGDLQEEGDVRNDIREIMHCISKTNKLNPHKFIQPGEELVIWKKVPRKHEN